MLIKEFPYCCTALIAADFGESMLAYGGDFVVDEKHLTKKFKENIEFYKNMGKAMLVATTNNEQKTANKVLKSLGFRGSKWMSKKQHPETKVKLWYKHLQD